MASQYPAVCSRPPWAPGWCLHCGALGWKAPQRLPPLCECVQERTQLTLFGGEGRTSGKESEKKGNDMYNKLQKSTAHYTIKDWFGLLFWLCISEPQLTFFIQGYWSGGPAVCLFIFKNNSQKNSPHFSFWCNQRWSLKTPLQKFFFIPGFVADENTFRPLS